MRVCPLCEFIYEDDQSLCDMDGTALVYDPAPRALAPLALPARAAPPRKSRTKRFAATAATGVVLGTVLVLVFHVSTLRSEEQLSTTTPASPRYSSPQIKGGSEVPLHLNLELPVPLLPPFEAVPIPVPAASPESPVRQSTRLTEEPRENAAGNGSAPAEDPPAPAALRTDKKEEKEQRTVRANPKPVEIKHKDSGISSFFKKTGRILKKPFSH